MSAVEAKRFALLEFNEDHLVVELPNGKVLGVLDDTYGEDPIWYEDPQQHLKLLFKALGWECVSLNGWQQELIGAAMRQQRDCLDYANHGSPVSIGPGELLRLALEQTPDLLTTQPLATEPGCLIDGLNGDAHGNVQLCAWAYQYGWAPVEGETEFGSDAAARYAEDALAYLNENAVPRWLTLSWHEGDLVVTQPKEEELPF